MSGTPRYRRDVVSAAASVRGCGVSRPSTVSPCSMAWRLISTRVGAALLLPQRAFVPAVVALQVAESHVRGRAGLQPGVVVRLNGHERLQELARRGAARQRHTMMARREAPLGPRAFFKRPRSLPTTGAEQRASERRGPSCGFYSLRDRPSELRSQPTSSPRKGPCSRDSSRAVAPRTQCAGNRGVLGALSIFQLLSRRAWQSYLAA